MTIIQLLCTVTAFVFITPNFACVELPPIESQRRTFNPGTSTTDQIYRYLGDPEKIEYTEQELIIFTYQANDIRTLKYIFNKDQILLNIQVFEYDELLHQSTSLPYKK